VSCLTTVILLIDRNRFGNPPVFPVEAAEAAEEPADDGAANQDDGEQKKTGVKSKTLMKTGGQKWQWKIMEDMGVPSEEIPKFADPTHWVYYFPHLGQQDLRAFGACIDWRRSFVTTDVNPYYDSFVRWQYNTLKAQDRFTFGKRFAIWAPKEGQPCADHERSSGEGVLPQDYTLIKMRVLVVPASIAAAVGNRNLFLVAGTMRPETM
jgi:leucyl-tRNA synthetase